MPAFQLRIICPLLVTGVLLVVRAAAAFPAAANSPSDDDAPQAKATQALAPQAKPPAADRELFVAQVVDGKNGQPVPGAKVALRFRDRDAQRRHDSATPDGFMPPLAESTATTDAKGRFAFVVPAVCAGLDLVVERVISHPDFIVDRSFGSWDLPLSLIEDSAKARDQFGAGGVWRLQPGHEVTGQVLDPGGQPAHGVPVYVAMQYPEYVGMQPLALTDAGGRFAVRMPSFREDYRLFIMPRDAVCQSREVSEGFGEQPVIRLERGRRVRGQVLDAQGRGVPRAVVQGNGDDSVYQGIDRPLVCVFTDANGRYELPPLTGMVDVRVLDGGWAGAWMQRGVKLNGVYLPAVASLPPADEAAEGDAELTLNFAPVESVTLTATYLDKQGAPKESAAIELYGTSPAADEGYPQRWRGRFRPVAEKIGVFELRVPKGLRDAAIDLMHDGEAEFADATRVVQPGESPSEKRTEVRYNVIDADDDSLIIRLRARTPARGE